MNVKLSRFKRGQTHPFNANEMRVAGVLFTSKGREFTAEEIEFLSGVHENVVPLIIDRLREKNIDICTDERDGKIVHYVANNKCWHYLIGGALVAVIVVMFLHAILTT